MTTIALIVFVGGFANFILGAIVCDLLDQRLNGRLWAAWRSGGDDLLIATVRVLVLHAWTVLIILYWWYRHERERA
jgi:hypothetical protein